MNDIKNETIESELNSDCTHDWSHSNKWDHTQICRKCFIVRYVKGGILNKN